MAPPLVAVREHSQDVEAVVFDMDGLMLDTERIYRCAWQRAAAELGCVLDDREYEGLTGRPIDDGERDLLHRFGSGFPLGRFQTRWREIWRALAGAGIPVKPGLFELLEFVDTRGHPTAVATSSTAEYARFSLRQAGLEGRFRAVVTVDQVARGKPAPDVYLEAARQVGVSPHRCAALEDSEAGLVAASRAGMIAVLVPDLAPPSRVSLQTASYVCRSLGDAQLLLAALFSTETSR